MSPRRCTASLACSLLLLVACQADRADPMAPPSTATATAQADAPLASPVTTDAPAMDPMVRAADDGQQILHINTARGSVDCTGRHVEVLSSNAELGFTGQCLELYFLGSDTRATIQSATMVQVVGDRVALTIDAPLAELRQLGATGQHVLDAVEGELYVQGDDNQIRTRRVGEVRLIGSRNQVHWQVGEPETSDIGNNNVLGAIE